MAESGSHLSNPTLRSMTGMSGLLLAEVGDSMVELDIYGEPGGSGFRVDQRIAPDCVSPGGSSRERMIPQRPTHRKTISGGLDSLAESLSRSDTFLDIAAPARSSAELKSLLGNAQARLKPGAAMFTRQSFPGATSTSTNIDALTETIPLEQARSRARVEVDIILESETCVQGGYLKGHIRIHVRKFTKHDPPVLLSQGKVRVVGFECIPYDNNRYMFYQHSASFAEVITEPQDFYRTEPDDEGWAEAKEGTCMLPFSMRLPLVGTSGMPKGALNVHSGVALRYVAMACIKIKDSLTWEQSIAHFYRQCEVWPRLNPETVLASAPRPLVAEAAKGFLFGGSGKVKLTAKIHRLYWIAGQHCSVKIRVVNDTKKVIKSASIALVRTTTVFRPHPYLDAGQGPIVEIDACRTSTMVKQVAENTLSMGHRCAKGHASAKGWWTGVEPGQSLDFAHSIVLPQDALSVARVRLLEVEYSLRISVSAGPFTSDACVNLPIRIVNFLSLDPPHTSPLATLKELAPKPRILTRETWYRKSRPDGGEHHGRGETVPGMKYSNQDTDVDLAPLSAKPVESLVPNSEIMDPNTSIDSGSVYPPTDTATEAGTIIQSRFERSPMGEGNLTLQSLEVNNSFSRLRVQVEGIDLGDDASDVVTPTVANMTRRPRGPRSETFSSMPSHDDSGEAEVSPELQTRGSYIGSMEPGNAFSPRVHNKLVAFAVEDENVSRSVVGREMNVNGLAARQVHSRSMFLHGSVRMLPKPPTGIVHRGSMSALLTSPSAFISGWRAPRKQEATFVPHKSSGSVRMKIRELETKMRGDECDS